MCLKVLIYTQEVILMNTKHKINNKMLKAYKVEWLQEQISKALDVIVDEAKDGSL